MIACPCDLQHRYMSQSPAPSPSVVSRLAIRDVTTGLSLVLRDELPVTGFDCGDADLNEWFAQDVVASTEQLLVKNFELKLPGDSEKGSPVGLVSLSNDNIRLRDLVDIQDIPKGKRFHSWPAVKIARLGVAQAFQRQGFGREIIRLVAQLFTTDNRTGCRFITLEAYNKPSVIAFYESTGFEFITSSDIGKETRHMYFDLIRVDAVSC